MKNKALIALALLIFVLAACSPAKTAVQDLYDMGMSPAVEAPAALPAQPEMSFNEESSRAYDAIAGEGQSTGNSANRLVIRNATLSIVVDDPNVALGTISRMAERMGGYVVNSNIWKSTNYNGMEVPEANINVRVPVALLNQALDEIKNLVNNRDLDVLTENVTGQDVTQEYTDLNSRLRILEDTEEQLRLIMDEARRTEDVISVFNQLTYYREQIEVTKGQIKYYEESAALSSISVRIQAHEAVNPITVAGWKPSVTVSKALQSLIDAMQVIVDAAIYIVITIIPVIIVILLPLYLIFLIIRSAVRRSGVKKRTLKAQEMSAAQQQLDK